MDKKVLIIVGVVVLLLLGGGGYYVLSSNKASQEKPEQKPIIEDEVIESITPSDLGFKLILRSDNRAVKFEITNIKDIETVDYEISYTKEIDEEKVPEGLIGTAKKVGNIITLEDPDYREFGTCSSGRCRYDRVVSPVKVTLKILKTNGKTYKSEESISL
ncbi:MAG: hypothetical protein Q7K55_07620 [Candidatus Levybacteria bacterium]|nr:hypothetical protein [Candidatus Levybacteria bacterium]